MQRLVNEGKLTKIFKSKWASPIVTVFKSNVHHDDLVIVGDGIESVGDRQDGCIGESFANAFLDEAVGLHIHVRSGLIQDQEFVVSEKGSRQAKQLLLPH